MLKTLTGVNGFLIKSELDRIVSAHLEEYGDMALERLDCEEAGYGRITEALQSLPFLVEKKLVVLRSPSSVKQFTESFEQLLPTIPDMTDVVIVEPKLDKRISYYKQLKKLTDFKECNELDGGGLSVWLMTEAKSRGGGISIADARYLVERAGANQQLLGNELDKLLAYDKKITRGTIDLLTEPTPQSTIFELLDAAFAGNRKRALELYADQRKQKVEPLNILAMISWQLHVLALIKTAGERSADEIAAQAKLSPFVVRKSLNIARRLPNDVFKRLLAEVLELDVRLKSEAIDADEALNHLIIKISRL